jgi:hypothetical protein
MLSKAPCPQGSQRKQTKETKRKEEIRRTSFGAAPVLVVLEKPRTTKSHVPCATTFYCVYHSIQNKHTQGAWAPLRTTTPWDRQLVQCTRHASQASKNLTP